MTSRLNPRVNYTINDGDEQKTRFEFNFPVLNKQDIKVITSDGIELNNYTVTILKETIGGHIDLSQPLSVGTRITIYRHMTYNRQTIFRENEDFRASVINEEFDRIIMLLQQVGRYSKDSIRTPLSDDDMNMILPTAKKRSNSILGFDSLGRTKIYKDLSQSTLQAERFSIDAKNNADITTRNRRILETKYNEMNEIYAGKNLSNVSNEDFKNKADISGISGALPTSIFTQKSGKFFVRNTDGSLPNNINPSNVWSLADQSSSTTGTMPSNKNHIELPAGKVLFKLAGGGGGGGHGWKRQRRNHGGRGGNTSIYSLHITAYGGRGGKGAYENDTAGQTGASGSGGMVIAGGGGNGAGGGSHDFKYAQDGRNGGLVKAIKVLSSGDVFDYIVGAGGLAGKDDNGHLGYGFNGNTGSNGYIEVDYV